MGFKIRNEKLAGLEVIISSETVVFDAEGIAEIVSGDIYGEVIVMSGFSGVTVDDEIAKAELFRLEQEATMQAEADKLKAEEAKALELQAEADKLKAEADALNADVNANKSK